MLRSLAFGLLAACLAAAAAQAQRDGRQRESRNAATGMLLGQPPFNGLDPVNRRSPRDPHRRYEQSGSIPGTTPGTTSGTTPGTLDGSIPGTLSGTASGFR